MTTQQIIAVGQMWPDGDENAIRSAIEYIGEQQPDRVIATVGATEGFLRDVRAVYDGWVGAHLTSPRLCDEFGVDSLPDLFKFAPGWASYSGSLEGYKVRSSAILSAGKDLNMSLLSGALHDFQMNSHMLGGSFDSPLRAIVGLGVGHLQQPRITKRGDCGFAHLSETESWIEGKLIRLREGQMIPIKCRPAYSLPSDVKVDPMVWLRAFGPISHLT